MATREIGQILELWTKISNAEMEAVLATVIRTEGSSYRLPGARLLLTQDGRRAGSVSGGCLEEDLVRKSWWYTEGGPSVRRYDTTAEGEIAGQYGLGCNGVIHIHLERVGPGRSAIFEQLTMVAHTRVPAYWELKAAGETVFAERLTPPPRLLIFGAGDDAIPVTELANQQGWEVHVTDGRAHYARSEKFPRANSVSLRPAGGELGVVPDPWTAAIAMSHSYSQDLKNLKMLLGAGLPYVGVLGPRKRTDQMMEELGVHAPENLFSPMGLDLGADGPEQVALSVVSEIRAVLNGRAGAQLRNGKGSIH